MNQTHVNLQQRRLLSSKETAHALSVSERHLANLRMDHGLPIVRLGNAVRYDTADLLNWIAANKCLPQPSAN